MLQMRMLLTIVCVAGAFAQVVPAPGNVALPLDDYNSLVERAAHPPRSPEAAPIGHVLKSAQINLSVQAESVTGTVALNGETLSAGNRKVPLVTGFIVTDAQRGGADLPLEQSGGIHSALLPGPGAFDVTLTAALPLNMEAGRASFNLPAPSAGAVRLTLLVPGAQTLVNLTPGIITSRTTSNGRTTVEAVLVPGQTSNIWWAARLNSPAAPAAPKEVRFLSDVKTLISVSENDLSVAALTAITVVQGEPAQFRIPIPAGFELTGATGPAVSGNEMQGTTLLLTVSDPAARVHEFLISFSRENMSKQIEVPLLTFTGTQRETGEVLIEGQGAMELTAGEKGGLQRIDLKESHETLRSLANTTLHAAFRYQKRPAEAPAVALEWIRFPESAIVAAVAQKAVITTLVTSEGRSLTEVKLTVKNKAQPFLKLKLPVGATILSADVAGEKVKPVQGADGNRVPLLRAGFRPTDAYEVTFVFLHAGAPFAKKGDAELTLPKMDIPIGQMQWEVFLPQRYKVADFAGNALSSLLLRASTGDDAREVSLDNAALLSLPVMALGSNAETVRPGVLGGIVVDPTGAIVTNAQIDVRVIGTGATYNAVSDRSGRWAIANLPPGRLSVMVNVPGFKIYVRELDYNPARVTTANTVLQVGETAESVTVTAESSLLKTQSAEMSQTFRFDGQQTRSASTLRIPQLPVIPPSANVSNLQQRVAGVLPISVNVPRTGNSYQFARALVMDEETTLTFKYRRQ